MTPDPRNHDPRNHDPKNTPRDLIMTDTLQHRLGTATLTPCEPVVAGSYQQWTLTLTVGSYGIDEGGSLKIAQRFACDMQPAQFVDPKADAYCSVTTTGDAKLAARHAPKGHDRPWMRWCVIIDVYDGSLSPGDTVTLTIGDRTGGSRGIRVQTFIESAHEFRVFVDPTNAAVARPIAQSPKFPVMAGEAVELIAIAPSDAVVGEPLEVFIKGQDLWGNPTPAPAQVTLYCDHASIEGRLVTLSRPGVVRITAIAGDLQCTSNPIIVHDAQPTRKRYWGDLHAQSDATVGVGTEVEYFTFARDWARVDFTSHQGNDFQVDDEAWQRLNDVVRDFQEDGRFVVFPGFEWSANTPAGGDRNVFYREEGLPIIRNSHWQVPHVPENEVSPAHPGDVFFERVSKLVPRQKVILGSHVGGRWADVKAYFDPDAHNLVELVSCWGVFEWMLHDALDAGHIVGVMCNSDGHKGRPGAEGPGAGEFGIAGGLTCVLADELTRDGVWEALAARRCYGTTGARIMLDFTCDGQPMGSIVNNARTLHARAVGQAPLESLQLFRGRELIREIQPEAFRQPTKRVRVMWAGSRMRGRGRRANWSGSIHTDAAILAAHPVSFDSKADGITDVQSNRVTFRSQTTGDADGIDLDLDALHGSLTFDSPMCKKTIDLAAGKQTFNLGGLDLRLIVQPYPQRCETFELSIDQPIDKPGPYFIKATQTDGHMAWSSPIYVG